MFKIIKLAMRTKKTAAVIFFIKIWVALLAIIFSIPTAYAEPLGLKKGMTLAQLKHLKGFSRSERPGWFSASQVPSGHTEFERYYFLIDPAFGLCRVVAAGKTIPTDQAGHAIRKRHARLKAELSQKYGASSNSFDLLMSSVPQKNSADWMRYLRSGERTFATFWSNPGVLNAYHLQAIQLEARAIDESSGWLFVIYEFQGADVCVGSKSTSL